MKFLLGKPLVAEAACDHDTGAEHTSYAGVKHLYNSGYTAMPRVRIDGVQLCDWDSFHSVFVASFGFPDFYGRNMNAWIDCMTSLDTPDDGMTSVHGSASDPIVLQLDNASSVPKELFDALVECAAFVNWRRLEVGEPAILMLAFQRAR